MSGFTRPQIKKLVKKLDRTHVHTREVSGRKLDYIEGWFAISEANAIFGFAGWDREMAHFERVFESRVGDETSCAYLARVRVTVRTEGSAVIREGTGFGQARARLRGEAHERALKAAETDATKRALATFGNRFGLALYDKDQNGVTTGVLPRARSFEGTSAPTAKPTAARCERHAGPVGTARPANIFVLRDGDDEILASALSGEGFCTGMRQLIEAYEGAEDLERLRIANVEMLQLLRIERPSLKSSKGDHFADILERLIAKKRSRLTDLEPSSTGVRSDEKLVSSQRIGRPARPSSRQDQPANGVKLDPQASPSGVNAQPPSGNGGGEPASALSAGSEHQTSGEPQTPDQPAGNALSASSAPGANPIGSAPKQSLETRHHPSRIAAGVAIDKSLLLIATTRRVRNRAHLLSVASRPCLICEDLPCHAHHLTFAQPKGLSIKVSDEFTVPLCAVHHNALHGHGNERNFWHQQGVDPLIMARRLWLATLSGQDQAGDQK